MFKFAKILALVFVCSLFLTPAVMAQDSTATSSMFPSMVGYGLVVIGAAYGIGKLAAASVESMARQPEVAGTIQISMIIAAALIEGFTFAAIFFGK